ncbi:hypothetical protein T05_9392 [Trichinella murrelli]|uniref:Uncharacterized protein n=1 Tax=Trichinella murrelli TaxID=144512 RepID=A0A0V0T1R3_9BILA|nr:hypothetical protein T05_6483 [Trichinella murrelli]KRX32923.1 hypothetical protein T05_9392 [Trichinella murrelli]
MALQDSTVILSVRNDGSFDVQEGYMEHRASGHLGKSHEGRHGNLEAMRP